MTEERITETLSDREGRARKKAKDEKVKKKKLEGK